MSGTIDEIHLFGMWNQRGGNPSQGISEDGRKLKAWVEGKTDDCPPEVQHLAREVIRAQDSYKTQLESQLRLASSELQALATSEIGPMDLPSDMAGAVEQQHRAARYEVAMFAAQRILDAVNRALGES